MASIIPKASRAIPDGDITWKMSSRKRRKDDLTFRSEFGNFEVAKEFADELAKQHKHYEAIIVNSKGVQVYSTRNRVT